MSEELGATEREIVAQRLKKAEQLRQLGVNPYGNGHVPAHLARDLHARYGEAPPEEIARDPGDWSVAGRVLAVRSFGKAAFLKVRDRSRRDPGLGEEGPRWASRRSRSSSSSTWAT